MQEGGMPQIPPEVMNMLAQLENIRKQIILFQTQLRDLENTVQTLKSLKEYEGDEIILPIGSGIFVKAKVEDKNKLLVELGSDIFGLVSVEDALKILEKRREEVNKVLEQLSKMEESLRAKIEEFARQQQK